MENPFVDMFTGKRGNLIHPKKENPEIPEPMHKEYAPELLTEPKPKSLHDLRPTIIKPFETVKKPQFNRTYGSLRTEDSWEFMIDNYANGNITTIAGSQVSVAVTLAEALPEIRLSQWPGAVSLYLCIRMFNLMFSGGSLTTNGSIDVYFQSSFGGHIVPLGGTRGQSLSNSGEMRIIVPGMITDPGITNVGNLLATLSGGASAGTYAWNMGFSYVYLLPTMKPYEVQHVEDLLDAHPGIVHRFNP